MESRESLEQAAASWIARRDGGRWSAEDAAALQAWLAQSAGHRAAYYRLNAAWQEAGRLTALKSGAAPIDPIPKTRAGAAGTNTGASFAAISPGAIRRLDPRHSRSPTAMTRYLLVARRLFRPGIAVAATLLIHLGGAALIWLHGEHPSHRYATALGELESVPLSDGSRVTLNTDSSLRIALQHSERRVDLDHGEAFFEVAKDPERPFIVVAGDRTIVAVGTQFSVRREGDDVRVVVSEGTVRMEPFRGVTGPAQQTGLAISQQNALWRAGTVARVWGNNLLLQKEATAEIDASLSWRTGLLTFRDTPLAAAIAEFNRYNARKILIEDPTLASVSISGVFRSTQLAPFIHLLEQRFPLRAHVEDNRVLLSVPDRTEQSSN